MPNVFRCCMFFLSFFPLWICVVFIDVMKIVSDKTNLWSEIIELIVISLMTLFCTFVICKVLKINKGQNCECYKVIKSEIDTISTSTYLLTNVLPLLAFDFTKWKSTITFLIIILFLFLMNSIHNRYDCNICLELMGYRMYTCWLKDDREEQRQLTVLIRNTSLNANDEIAIHKLNDNLFFGYSIGKSS